MAMSAELAAAWRSAAANLSDVKSVRLALTVAVRCLPHTTPTRLLMRPIARRHIPRLITPPCADAARVRRRESWEC